MNSKSYIIDSGSLLGEIHKYCMKENKIMNDIDINEFLIESTLNNYKIDKSKVIDSKVEKSIDCPNYRVIINYLD